MTTPLASIFSMLDRVKRNLTLRGMEGTMQRTGQNLEQFGKLQEAAATGDAGAQKAVTDKLLEQVLNFSPLGITLYHGGPQAIAKVLPEKLGAVGQMQGPGFYASNLLNVPKMFAVRAGKKTDPGVITAFEFPDELYNRILPLTDAPLAGSKLANTEALHNLMLQNPSTAPVIRTALKQSIKDAKSMGTGQAPDELLTGELINWALNSKMGKSVAARELAESGISGKSWQYTHELPDEAAVIFTRYIDELRPVGNVQVAGPEEEYTQRLLEQVLRNTVP